MNKTKIEWCDSTWNPITGCLHDCEYCYAQGIAKRFEGVWDGDNNCKLSYSTIFPKAHEVTGNEFDGLGFKYRVGNDNRGPKLINAPYPYGFMPTLHRHRLESGLARFKKPKNIFVCSMADVFGEWVPDEWIEEVFMACDYAQWHRYLFLTKNPQRIDKMIDYFTSEERHSEEAQQFFKNFWFGTTVTSTNDLCRKIEIEQLEEGHRFLSIEPLLEPITFYSKRDRCPICGSLEIYEGNVLTTPNGKKTVYCDNCGEWEANSLVEAKPSIEWIIIGTETGNRKEKVIPKREWIEDIVSSAREVEIPIFMKNSLAKVWGEPLIQEYPWAATARR